MNKKTKPGYEIEGREVKPIICVYCHPSGLDGASFIEDLGFCVKCKSYYKYDLNGKIPHVEIFFDDSDLLKQKIFHLIKEKIRDRLVTDVLKEIGNISYYAFSEVEKGNFSEITADDFILICNWLEISF